MSNRSWVDRLHRSRTNRLYLVRGNDSKGRAAWYYVRVTKSLILFERALKSGSLNVTDYAEIILSGFGENPPQDVVEKMREEWGFQG